jgi:hypothetical protein
MRPQLRPSKSFPVLHLPVVVLIDRFEIDVNWVLFELDVNWVLFELDIHWVLFELDVNWVSFED